MVASQNSDPVLIPDFESENELDDFYGVEASVNVVSEKEVVGVREFASDVE